MSRIVRFHRHFHVRESGSWRNSVVEAMRAICNMHGLKPPGSLSTDIDSNRTTLDSLRSGDCVVAISLLDLGEIDELATVVRGLLSRGVRVVTAEASDLVGSVRVIECLCGAYEGLVKENKALKARVREDTDLIEAASANIAAGLAEKLEQTFRQFNVEHTSSAYGAAYLIERKKRLAAAKKGE